MKSEPFSNLEERAGVHAALGDPARLRIVDLLLFGDASPSELAAELDLPSNLLAHHLNVLETSGVVSRRRSEGDRRRTYLRLMTTAVDKPRSSGGPPERLVFVCTANSARSHLAAALWRQASGIPSASAGTHPADRIDPSAVDVAHRHRLPLPRIRPRHLDDVIATGDLVVTVCDNAHEELGRVAQLHWSVPDPVPSGTERAFEHAFDDLTDRVNHLASRLPSAAEIQARPERGQS